MNAITKIAKNSAPKTKPKCVFDGLSQFFTSTTDITSKNGIEPKSHDPLNTPAIEYEKALETQPYDHPDKNRLTQLEMDHTLQNISV